MLLGDVCMSDKANTELNSVIIHISIVYVQVIILSFTLILDVFLCLVLMTTITAIILS